MIFCSVQDAVNLLTLFKYLLVLIVSLLNKTSIDGSIFLLVLLVLFINISKNLLLSFCERGCKDKDFYFKLPNYSGTFFLKVCFIILYRRSLSNAGAKVVL